MTNADLRHRFAIAIAALLTACGGSPDAADPSAATAAQVVQVNAPRADCEADGCTQPRIVDGLAEQYRGAASALPAADPAPAADAKKEAAAPFPLQYDGAQARW